MCPRACNAGTLPTLAQIKANIMTIDYVLQSDAVLSQVNPVSNTIYNVLPATDYVKVISAEMSIIWAVTQPTNLRLISTVDGQTITHTKAAPVSTSPYNPMALGSMTPALQGTDSGYSSAVLVALQNISGKSVKIDVAITWGVTQPTPLFCRIKYSKKV